MHQRSNIVYRYRRTKSREVRYKSRTILVPLYRETRRDTFIAVLDYINVATCV